MSKFNKINLYASLLKTKTGKYKAILSDDSIDREDEIVGKSFLEGALGGKTFGLIDHENKVENRVCDWVNKKLEFIKGHNALTAEPKWFLSNPKAQLVKGLLDDGAELGISIGAIPSASDTVKIKDKEYKRYTKGEILEGSFVGIPANANAGARNIIQTNCRDSNLLIAKSLNFEKIDLKENTDNKNLNLEEIPMEKEIEAQKAKEVMITKANEIIAALGKATQEDVVKVLEAASIDKEVYEDLVKDIPLTKPKQPPKKKPSEEEEDKDDKDKKSLTKEDIQKLVDEQVSEKLKETPLFKIQADFMDMTPEKEKNKAAELQEKGMLPILGRF